MDTSKDYYKILGIQPEAVPEEIKSAFRRMAKLYSPDVNHSADAISRFEDILEAWEVLGRPSLRVEYDMSCGFWFDGKVYTRTQQSGSGSRHTGFGGTGDMAGSRSSWYSGDDTASRPPSWDFRRKTAAQNDAQERSAGGFQGGSSRYGADGFYSSGDQRFGAENMRYAGSKSSESPSERIHREYGDDHRNDAGDMRSGGFYGVYRENPEGTRRDSSEGVREGGRLSRREAERRRMAEEMRRQHRDEVQGYFEDGGILLPLIISFVVLASTGLLLILRYGEMYFGISGAALSSYTGIAKFVVSAMVFTLLFWLAFWLMSLFLRPPDMSIRLWSKAAAAICALICGALYGLWMTHLAGGGGFEMRAFTVWFVPFALTFFIAPFLMRRGR